MGIEAHWSLVLLILTRLKKSFKKEIIDGEGENGEEENWIWANRWGEVGGLRIMRLRSAESRLLWDGSSSSSSGWDRLLGRVRRG